MNLLRKKEVGQSAVEFALILPILLLLFIGMIEFGWLLNAKITVNSAAREVARTMVVAEGTVEEKKERAEIIATNNLGNKYIIDYPRGVPGGGESIEVVITDSVRPIVGLYVRGEQKVAGSAIMRME